MNPLTTIAGLMSLCGIVSVRMFAPAFLFGAICRFLPMYDWCPAGVSELASHCPAFLMGDFGLCVFGVLGVLEIAANWDDTIRELISESNLETYIKPLYAALVSYSICTPEQIQVLAAVVDGVPDVVIPVATNSVVVQVATNAVESAVHGAAQAASTETGSSFMAIVSSVFCAGGTFTLCKVRSCIVSSVRELDPDDSLHLNTFLTLFEEGSWLAILPVLIVFPVLALLLMAVFAVFGWVLSVPLKKFAAKRRAHWDAVGKDDMLKMVRDRAIIIFIAGVFLCTIPVFGYLLTIVALNLFVFSVIALYEKPSHRLLFKLLMRFLKLTLFLFSVVFSVVPCVGIVFLVPYVISFVLRTRDLRR